MDLGWYYDGSFRDFYIGYGRFIYLLKLLMLRKDGKESNVARCDTAHGTPHLDLLGKRRGLLTKTWYVNARMDAVLRRAVDDFKSHYEHYIRN